MIDPLPRCPRCGYALIRGLCPIHDGRQASDRQPMLAPLPAAPDVQPENRAKVLRFVKPKRRAS